MSAYVRHRPGCEMTGRAEAPRVYRVEAAGVIKEAVDALLLVFLLLVLLAPVQRKVCMFVGCCPD